MRNSAPSANNHNFAQIPSNRVVRSRLQRNSNFKSTFNAGYLVPCFIDEVLPSDVISVNLTAVSRLLTPLKTPIMDNLYLDFHFFYVPNRLLWVNWERFLGAQDNPGDSVDYVVPSMLFESWSPAVNSIFDYMRFPLQPTNIASDTYFQSLNYRAYNLIWNTWFRDENLQDSVFFDNGDGPDDVNNYNLLKRGKRHDYFTSSLPFVQKGDAVLVPLFPPGSTAPVVGDGTSMVLSDGSANVALSGFPGSPGFFTGDSSLVGVPIGTASSPDLGAQTIWGLASSASGVIADLSSATTTGTITALRQAIVMQQILEANARGGTRYTEILRSQFDVAPEDYRLQRPEYLGGSTQPLLVTSVPQTSESDVTPQGTLTSFVSGSGHAGFHHSFVEHGWILGFCSVRSDMTYQNQLHRMFTRKTVLDYWRAEFSHLSEQSVLNQELGFSNNTTQNQTVFGYQERGAEYRYFPNVVTGYFRSNSFISTGSLDSWHLAFNFGTNVVPNLNSDFIEENPPVDRIIAVESSIANQFLIDISFQIAETRPMPIFSVPGLRRF